MKTRWFSLFANKIRRPLSQTTKNKVLPHWDNRQTRTRNKHLFTRRTGGFGPLSQSHLDVDWFSALRPLCCQNFESRCAWFKRVNRREKKNTSKVFGISNLVETWKALHVEDIVSCECQERSCIYIAVSDQMWSLARENLKAVVWQNDIHEKQWKTELRLIRVMMTLQAEQSN